MKVAHVIVFLLFASLLLVSSDAQAACDPTFNRKYTHLMMKFSVPQDRDQYGNCKDWGYWGGKEYAGYSRLPKGFWVYAYPNWYIFNTNRKARQSSYKFEDLPPDIEIQPDPPSVGSVGKIVPDKPPNTDCEPGYELSVSVWGQPCVPCKVGKYCPN